MTDLASRVAEHTWYHSIELPGGVTTPGFFDTITAAGRVDLPDSLAGKRCLDIGSCDGFWAFELERRGAREVEAIDLADPAARDWPGNGRPDTEDPGRSRATFALAAEALNSNVRRRDLSIYDVSPERLGTFDFVFIGNLLLHLRDPIGALMAVRSVVDGELFSVEPISVPATLSRPRTPRAVLSTRPVPYWWTPNFAGYAEYFVKSGFARVERGRPFFFPFGRGYYRRPPLGELARSPRQAFFWSTTRWLGAPTAWIRALPGQATPAGTSSSST